MRAGMLGGFVDRVFAWGRYCFGHADVNDSRLRAFRFTEEALELAQACDMTRDEVSTLVDYVFSRPKGIIAQEMGGTLLTLAILARINGVELGDAGENELQRAWENVEKIRAKNKKAKPLQGPLPVDLSRLGVQTGSGGSHKS